jgi:hypothetical protein
MAFSIVRKVATTYEQSLKRSGEMENDQDYHQTNLVKRVVLPADHCHRAI